MVGKGISVPTGRARFGWVTSLCTNTAWVAFFGPFAIIDGWDGMAKWEGGVACVCFGGIDTNPQIRKGRRKGRKEHLNSSSTRLSKAASGWVL